jgi:hypothetical protein
VLGSPANLYLFELIANAKFLVGMTDIAGADAVAASFSGGAAVIIGCCVAFLDADQKGDTKGGNTPSGMRLDELLRLIQKKVGITAFTDALESFASDRHFMKAGKQGAGSTPRGVSEGDVDDDDDGLDKIESMALYDKEFRRFYQQVVTSANKAIMSSYSGDGGGDEHAGMGGGGEGGGGMTAAFQEIIRKQDKELQEMKKQLQQQQKSGGTNISEGAEGEEVLFDAEAEGSVATDSEGGGALRRVEAGLAKRGAEHAEQRREEEAARRVEVEKEKAALERDQVALRRRVAVLEQELTAARSGEQQNAGAKDGLEAKLTEAVAAKDAAEEERRALSMSVANLEMEVMQKKLEKEAAESRAEMYEAQQRANSSNGAAAASSGGGQEQQEQEQFIAKADAAAAAKVAAIEFELDSSKKSVGDMRVRCEELEAELKSAREAERAKEQQVRDQHQLVEAAEQVASDETAEKVGVQAEVEELRRQLQERDTQLERERTRVREVEKEAAEARRQVAAGGGTEGGGDSQQLRDEVAKLRRELERAQQSGGGVAKASAPPSNGAGGSSSSELVQLQLEQQELEEEHADLLVLLASQEIEKTHLAAHLTNAAGAAATDAALAEAYSNGAINYGDDAEGEGDAAPPSAPPVAPPPGALPGGIQV